MQFEAPAAAESSDIYNDEYGNRNIEDFLDSLPPEVIQAMESGEFSMEQEHPLEGVSQCICGVVESLGTLVLLNCATCLLQFLIIAKIECRAIADLLVSLLGLFLLWTNSSSPLMMLPFMLYFASTAAFINTNTDLISSRNKGILCIIYTILYIAACQLYMEPENFLSIRGSWMIVAMKQISLCFDICTSIKTTDSKELLGYAENALDLDATKPSLLSQCAFVLNPSTLIFGPFITFGQFEQLHMHAKGCIQERRSLLVHFLRLARHLAQAFLCLLLSTCLLDPHLSPLPLNSLPAAANHALTALAFRCSHYFVCHLSTAFALLGGHGPLEVCRWQAIEWPRSIAQVAALWNVPMHAFLHKYVFCRASGQIGTFPAVLLTFGISGALHGLDIQLTAVLLSLGLFAFAEQKTRNALASTLSACIGLKECSGDSEKCGHRRKKSHPLVVAIGLLFVAINIHLLVYLGAPFYGEGQFNGYNAAHLWHVWWGQFRLSGHILPLAMLLGSMLITSWAKQKQQ